MIVPIIFMAICGCFGVGLGAILAICLLKSDQESFLRWAMPTAAGIAAAAAVGWAAGFTWALLVLYALAFVASSLAGFGLSIYVTDNHVRMNRNVLQSGIPIVFTVGAAALVSVGLGYLWMAVACGAGVLIATWIRDYYLFG